jgi:hypothetical protein
MCLIGGSEKGEKSSISLDEMMRERNSLNDNDRLARTSHEHGEIEQILGIVVCRRRRERVELN